MGMWTTGANGKSQWREDLADTPSNQASYGEGRGEWNGTQTIQGPAGGSGGGSGSSGSGGGSGSGGSGSPALPKLNDLPTYASDPFKPVGMGATKDNFTFDPSNAARAFQAGMQANGFDTLNPNGAAGVLTRRGSDFQRLFPLLAAIQPGTYGNANSVVDSQRFFGSLPNTFEALIRQDPKQLLGNLFTNHDVTSPMGQLQKYLENTPDELANVLSAVTGLNASPYASNFFGNYLRNLVSGANSNAGLLNSHGGNLLGAVQELLNGVKTFQ